MYSLSRLKLLVFVTILLGKSASETLLKTGRSTTKLHNGHLAAFALMMHVTNHLSAHSRCIVCPQSNFSTLLSWTSGSKHIGHDSSLETSPMACLDAFLQHHRVTSRSVMYELHCIYQYTLHSARKLVRQCP